MGVFTVRLGENVWRLWKAGERIRDAEKQVKQEEQENQELRKRLTEVQSPEFIEKEAREKLGLGKEGETIVVLPKAELEPSFARASERRQPNWRKWWMLYVGE